MSEFMSDMCVMILPLPRIFSANQRIFSNFVYAKRVCMYAWMCMHYIHKNGTMYAWNGNN